ncbi:MAG TPA: hypothetical protein VE914_11235 [Candidatus Angelobacter sp.]|nr:hypothetical protein [Candidatus Angelobacter sp.]
MTTAQPIAKASGESLSVLGTILQGYRAAARQAGSILILAIVWTAVAAGTGYLAEELTHSRSDLWAHYSLGAAIRNEAVEIPEYAELLLAASLIEIAIYRAIILADVPRWNAVWRIGRREMRYFALTILFWVPIHVGRRAFVIAVNLGAAPILVQHTIAAIAVPVLQAISISMIAHLLDSIALIPFFGLAFPLVAIGAPGGALRQSMRLSRTHRTRLATIGFLYGLPLIPLVYAPYLAGPITGALPILQSTAATFLSLLASALEAAVFAVAFQRVTAHLHKGTYDVFD